MDATKKFDGLSDIYEIGRPAYSGRFIEDLFSNYGADKDSVFADIGSGTGKFAGQILERGNFVFCVEPNDDMREKGEKVLKEYKNCRFIKGDSSATALGDNSVDIITAAQAFHWFDVSSFRAECKRILKPEGKVFLIWNMRDMDHDFTAENFEVYKKYCPDFKGFGGGIKRDDERIRRFFDDKYQRVEYDNPLILDKEKYIYRSLSGSYSLKEGAPQYQEYLEQLERLFDKYAAGGMVTMPNKTVVYMGELE